MNPNQLAALYTELQRHEYDRLSYEAIASALNAHETETQPNPITEAPLIPITLRMVHVLSVVMQHDLPGLKTLLEALSIQVADLVGRQVEQMDTESIDAYIDFFGATYLNAAAVAAVQSLLTNPPTEPDPSWSATITTTLPSRADDLGLGVVRCEDIQAALNYEVV